MNFENVPTYAWFILAIAGAIFLHKQGFFDQFLKSPVTTGDDKPMSLLDKLQGYRTKIAAVVIAVLGANEVLHFLPEQYVSTILYLAGAGGLYFLRDAVERLKQKFEPTKE